MARAVVIADDLTGAADCAASSAIRGCNALVILHSHEAKWSTLDWHEADVVSIDANSRCLTSKQASESTRQLVQFCDANNRECPEYLLFKKIDSTLRGHVAGEIAALLHARRSQNRGNTRLSVLMAPAFPEQGRTTVDGHLLVHGVRLEDTDIYQTEARSAESDISALLAKKNLSSRVISLSIVRSGATAIRLAVSKAAQESDVVVCDAETNNDLAAIAEASIGESQITALVGSAGLAAQIPKAIGMPVATPKEFDFARGSTLFVVGSASSVTRHQVKMLAECSDVDILFLGHGLQTLPAIQTQIMRNLKLGCDVVLTLSEGVRLSGIEWQEVSQAISDMAQEYVQFLGGLVATGGETARSVLDGLKIKRLRAIGEVEPGLPISIAALGARLLPVITKAGAFGSPHALVRCREFLRQMKRVSLEERHNNLFMDDNS